MNEAERNNISAVNKVSFCFVPCLVVPLPFRFVCFLCRIVFEPGVSSRLRPQYYFSHYFYLFHSQLFHFFVSCLAPPLSFRYVVSFRFFLTFWSCFSFRVSRRFLLLLLNVSCCFVPFRVSQRRRRRRRRSDYRATPGVGGEAK